MVGVGVLVGAGVGVLVGLVTLLFEARFLFPPLVPGVQLALPTTPLAQVVQCIPLTPPTPELTQVWVPLVAPGVLHDDPAAWLAWLPF